jgi:RHS repeat-associated protein
MAVALLATAPVAAPMQAEPSPAPLPTKPTSRTLQSPRATEAIVRKAVILRGLDTGKEHPMSLRPPLPFFARPGDDRLVEAPVLWDQFKDDYYKEAQPQEPQPKVGGSRGFGVGLMAAPFPSGEWRTPGHGAIWNGSPYVFLDFHDKYVDPDGANGWLWFSLWWPGVGQMIGTPIRGTQAPSGGQSTWFVGNSLYSGAFQWAHWAEDITGEVGGAAGEYTLYVNNPPVTPTPIAPVAGATVATPQPVLSISGSDPDGDYIAWEYRVTSDAGCSTVVTSSGWLPMGSTTWTPPLGALKDGQDYYWCARATDFVGRHYGSGESGWSAARLVKIRLPKRGVQSYWPMFSRGPLSVNEATGNLVISVPGPSFSSAAGSIGGGFSFNSFDTRGSVLPAATGAAWTAAFDGAPAKLVDHNLLSGDNKFDAVERVEADGTSSYYSHVAGGNTYQAAPGDASMLAKTTTGFVLTDPDGSIYMFGTADGSTGVAPPQQAQVSAAANGQAQLDYGFDSVGRPTVAQAKAKDTGGVLQTLQTLTFNWSCSGALVCITGPDAKEWRYEGESGASGKLMKVTNGTREILRIGYDGSGRPNSIKNANDLDPSHASTGHTTTHELQIAYDTGNKVAAITEKDVRNRYIGATARDLTWSFAYSAPGVATCPLTSRTAHPADAAAGHTGVTRTIVGCTDVTLPEPKASTGQANRTSVFYDNLAHPIETVDALSNYALAHWNERNTLEWTEDELKQPTDYEYDSFTHTLTLVKGPDPDGPGGPLPRPETKYFYDERAPGNGLAAGTALEGLQAFYYKNADLTGRPEAIQNDANVNFDWTVTGPAALGGQKTNIGVRWTGILTVPAQADYVLATKAEAGTRLVIDGTPLIDKWTGQASATPQCSPLVNLKAGKHWITLEYHQTTTTDTRVQLLWTAGGSATCANATTVVPSSALTPDWQNKTSTITQGSSTTGSGPRLAFSHFDKPGSRQPDYGVADTTGARLISVFTYDSFGRPTLRVTPKGNANRTIAANGDLTGSVVNGYDVSYGYYPIGETATACGGGVVNQFGLPKHITPHGIAPTTTTYDGIGRPIATTKAAGTTCRAFNDEGRLISEQAPGEAQATTYSYDPAGLVRTITNASGTLSTLYNESGQIVDSVDSYDAEMEIVYNMDGNPTARRVATGPLGASTVYDTEYVYNDDRQLVKQTFLPGQANPSGRTYEFSWDARGALKATKYPNGTFSWNDYLANGALNTVFNRHGALTSPPPATGPPPADGNALSDFTYDYYADGRRSVETRTGDGFASGETTSYSYDSVGRLASVSGAVNHTYCYDLNSNRTKLFSSTPAGNCASGTPDASYSYASSVLDQLTTVTPLTGTATAYGYDADGQATSRGADTLTWDGRGRHSGGTFASSDPGSISGVQFTVDGANQGSPVTSSPYERTLDTTSLSNGWHTIGAKASTTGGKQALAPTRVVRVQNGAGADTTAPTVSVTSPSGGASVSGTVAVSATASDNIGVTAVQFRRDGVDLGTDSTSPYSVNWSTATAPNGSHILTAVALDAAGNAATSSQVSVTVSNGGGVSGLVAAFGLDEGTGTSVADASGSGNGGTVSGASWVDPGKYGKALSFDGTDDYVTVADASTLDLAGSGTVMGWVKLDTLNRWHGLVAKGAANSTTAHNYSLEIDSNNKALCEISNGSASASVASAAALAANQYYHLACVWDGSNLRVYVGGSSNASVTQGITPVGNSSALHLGRYGGNSDLTDGVIDEVRIYNRALNQTEIQADMSTAVGASDSSAPTVSITAPSGGGVSGTVAVNATANDNVGVTAVQFRRDGVDLGSDSTSPYSVNWNTSTAPNGAHVLTAVALDAAGNATTSSQVTVTVGDATAPTTPGTPGVTVAPGTAQLSWTASTDASGVAYYRVHRSTTSGFTPNAGNEIGQTTMTSYTDNGDGTTAGLPAATYYYKLVAVDVNANTSNASAQGSSAVTADAALPTAAFSSPTPATASTASGTITLAATASSPTGGGSTLSGVQFTADGANHGSAVTSSPYERTLDTTTLGNGWHTIGATASTTGGKQAAAPTRVVRVQNGAGADTTAPSVSITAPTGGASVSGTVAVNATAADNVGVSAVQFRRDGVDLGSDSSSPYSVNWNTTTTPNGSHVLTAVALDAAGNATTSSQVSVTVSNSGGVAGLVAAYGLDEGTGTAVADASGTGNGGTASGASWVDPGKYGKALSFDGTDDYVSIADASPLDLAGTGTVMAWVKLDTLNRWHGLVAKGAANSPTAHNYALEIDSNNKALCEISNGSTSATVTSAATLAANQYYHLTCVWDGSNLRVYVGGSSNASVTQGVTPAGNSSALYLGQYGGNSDLTDGVIDEVRIYNRALNQTEIQTDMNTAVGASGDSSAPTVSITAPTGGAGVSGTVAVNATANDNVGVSAVQFRRDGVDLGFDSTSPYSVNWNTSTAPNGSHSLTAVALDAAGNATTSSQVNVTVGDFTAPTTPGTPVVTATPGTAQLSWTASTDASGIAYYRVYRSTTSGFTPSAGNEIAQTTLTSYTDNGDGTTAGMPAASYYYKIVAIDVNTNASNASAQGSGAVTADTALPTAAFTTPTPATTSTVNGTITLATTASSPGSGTTLSYGFDPAGFRRSRTANGQTTRLLLGGLIETTASGTITRFDVAGPAGDLAHYTAAPSSAVHPSYRYYSGHGDLAAEADHTGTRTRLIRLDPWGVPLASPGSPDLQELYTGRWDKKRDDTSGLIEMGARPYDPGLGRFVSVDPVDGGSCGSYDYACQDPVNAYDLTGMRWCWIACPWVDSTVHWIASNWRPIATVTIVLTVSVAAAMACGACGVGVYIALNGVTAAAATGGTAYFLNGESLNESMQKALVSGIFGAGFGVLGKTAEAMAIADGVPKGGLYSGSTVYLVRTNIMSGIVQVEITALIPPPSRGAAGRMYAM